MSDYSLQGDVFTYCFRVFLKDHPFGGSREFIAFFYGLCVLMVSDVWTAGCGDTGEKGGEVAGARYA